jgi:hypothetical protein
MVVGGEMEGRRNPAFLFTRREQNHLMTCSFDLQERMK